MMDQRVNSLSSDMRAVKEKERIKICNIIVFDQLSLCAQWVHLDKKTIFLQSAKSCIVYGRLMSTATDVDAL